MTSEGRWAIRGAKLIWDAWESNIPLEDASHGFASARITQQRSNPVGGPVQVLLAQVVDMRIQGNSRRFCKRCTIAFCCWLIVGPLVFLPRRRVVVIG